MTILYILIGLIIGSLLVYLIVRPKIKIIAQRNEKIEKENIQLEAENKILVNQKQVIEKETEAQKSENEQIKEKNIELLDKQNELQQNIEKLFLDQQSARIANTQLETQQESLRRSLVQLKETQTKTAQDYYDQALKIAQNAFDKEIERISNELEQHREEANEEYAATLEEYWKAFQQEFEAKQKEMSSLKEQLTQEQELVATAVAARQRQAQIEQDKDFYRLQISDDDIEEIKKIRSILPYLRDKEPLNKVIYKVYYEKPYTALIGRVLPHACITGIYKITNIQNGMCYIGQSVAVAERWRQHIRRGVGAEPPTRNKLYPAMLSVGVENFTFELLEECEAQKLNEREDFWQEFYHAKDYGYSIK